MLNTTEINERATGVLYHYTSPRAALNILKTGEFELSSSVGVRSEEKFMPRGYPYFLSTTRSRVGDYHRITGNTAVMFMLDGEYFNRLGLKVRPIDYWERSWSPESGRGSESEDRVYSQKPTIPANNIREVHVLIKSQDDLRSAILRQLLITAKKLGLATYLYKDAKDWRVQNRLRALPVKDALELLRGREPADRRIKGTNYLGGWLELVYKKSPGELTDRAKKIVHNLLVYNLGRGDDDLQLGVDLGNARKPDSSNRDTAIKIIELLKKYDLDTNKFVQMLYHKWAKIEGQKESIGEASGYIPTNSQEAQDPRWSSALTADVKPGEVKRQAAKFGSRTDAAGVPPIARTNGVVTEGLRDAKDNPCWKGYHPVGTKKKKGRTVPNCVPNESIEESYQLDESLLTEIKMAPGDLRRWADSAEAEGVVSGFEAELIFRDAGSQEEEEYEPDYDMDERARDISSVVDFFSNGDNGMSSRAAERLSTALQEEFWDWQSEEIEDAWKSDSDEIVRNYMEETVWEDDQDQYRERAAEQLGIETSEQSAEHTEEIEKLARELFEEDIEKEINEQGGYWDEAYENFADQARESGDFDEAEFFDNRYRYMSDVADSHNLDWPYMTGGDRGGGERDIETIANSLSRALGGAEVKASYGYHGTSRRPGRWIIEPDGSLSPDDEYSEAGLEVVSPPLPLKETLEKLDQVLEWASDDGDAYTNDSTGLHMGVSVPYKGGNVDYVKLILFLGDEYVLDKFGRASNSYTASSMKKLQQNIRAKKADTMHASRRVDPVAAMELMRKGLVELADRYVQDSVGQSKYTSAHIQEGYIEFRSPGGDYLSADNREIGVLRDTMLRFARAMHIASRPDLERKEYSKKLYKLLTGFKGAETRKIDKDTRYRTEIETEGVNDALELFAKFSTGMINKEELKKRWAEEVLKKEQSATADEKLQKYEIYNDATGETIDTIMASDLLQAHKDAFEKWGDRGISISVRPAGDTEEPAPEKKPSRRLQVARKIAGKPEEPSSATSGGGRGRYRVSWTERRDGQWVDDSLNIDAASAEAAVANVRTALQAQGRRPSNIVADPADNTPWQRPRQTTGQQEYQIYNPTTGMPVVAFMAASDREAYQRIEQYRQQHPAMHVALRNAPLPGSTIDLAQQRAQQGQRARRDVEIYNPRTGEVLSTAYDVSDEEIQARVRELEQERGVGPGLFQTRLRGQSSEQPQQSGQWTGRWQVKNRAGNVVYTFSGVGSSQADANSTAHTWLLSQGDRFDDQGPFDVVPEMVS